MLIIGVYVGHRLLNPFKPVEADYKPFESVAEYEAFIEANPLLITKVPAERNFIMSGIIREDKKAVYTIELQSRPIKPEMSETYIQSYLAMLDESQKDALDWIRSQGQNPDDMEIVWRPDPEDRRGRLLGESSKKNPQKGYDGNTTPTPSATTIPDTSLPVTGHRSQSPTSSASAVRQLAEADGGLRIPLPP